MSEVTPINTPHPVTLALATGRITPAMVDVYLELYANDANSILDLLTVTPADAVIKTRAVREAQAAEINRFARQRGISYGDAFVEIHHLATQVFRERVYQRDPEAA